MVPVFVAIAIPFAPAALPAYAASLSVTDAALDRWQPFITEASLRFNVPERWIRAVMQAESGGQTMLNGHPITSNAGAMGLMQVMPGTY
jgi:soluble lytic murein transglycosylase-like protein